MQLHPRLELPDGRLQFGHFTAALRYLSLDFIKIHDPLHLPESRIRTAAPILSPASAICQLIARQTGG